MTVERAVPLFILVTLMALLAVFGAHPVVIAVLYCISLGFFATR